MADPQKSSLLLFHIRITIIFRTVDYNKKSLYSNLQIPIELIYSLLVYVDCCGLLYVYERRSSK